jgi:hypothetical protein
MALGFGMIASVRGPHWAKNHAECMPVAGAISEYLNELPTKKVQAIMSAVRPLSLIIGLVVLLERPVTAELETMNNAKARGHAQARAINENPNSGAPQAGIHITGEDGPAGGVFPATGGF